MPADDNMKMENRVVKFLDKDKRNEKSKGNLQEVNAIDHPNWRKARIIILGLTLKILVTTGYPPHWRV